MGKTLEVLHFCSWALLVILIMFKPLEFYKNTPKLFQNYIIIPTILCLGPYLSFYNYN
jgi:hypothetical protein